ncbi:MAG: P-loop NTPase fold protein [Stellaceae bacterium]|jgi:predicted KAP-like P-loop ATPase
MSFLIPELKIEPNEGFTAENDIFNRRNFGIALLNIVRSLEEPAVLVLDSPWGTGKTTFIKMWRGELAKASVPSVYFDAFANDYLADAFIALAGETIAQVNATDKPAKKALKKFKEGSLTAARILGRASVRLGVRAATGGY